MAGHGLLPREGSCASVREWINAEDMSRIYLLATCLWAGSVGCAVATPAFMEDREPKEMTGSAESAKGEAVEPEIIAGDGEALVEVSNAGFIVEKDDKLECYRARPVGSNLSQRACDTKGLREERRKRDVREIERIRLRP